MEEAPGVFKVSSLSFNLESGFWDSLVFAPWAKTWLLSSLIALVRSAVFSACPALAFSTMLVFFELVPVTDASAALRDTLVFLAPGCIFQYVPCEEIVFSSSDEELLSDFCSFDCSVSEWVGLRFRRIQVRLCFQKDLWSCLASFAQF